MPDASSALRHVLNLLNERPHLTESSLDPSLVSPRQQSHRFVSHIRINYACPSYALIASTKRRAAGGKRGLIFCATPTSRIWIWQRRFCCWKSVIICLPEGWNTNRFRILTVQGLFPAGTVFPRRRRLMLNFHYLIPVSIRSVYTSINRRQSGGVGVKGNICSGTLKDG